MPGPIEPDEGRSTLGVVGYVLAAVIALAAGAWFAIHLSAKNEQAASVAPSSPAGAASTAPAVGTSAPIVALANAMAVQVSGAGATSGDRSADVVRKAFDDNVGSLVDTYNSALATDPKIADGMLIRLHFASDGTVSNSAVRTSTSPDPSLDAKVVAAMTTWKLPATKAGDVDADYPVIFAHDSSEEERLESDLQSKIASLAPGESPEYAAAPIPETSPAAASSAEAAGAPSSAAVASPAVAAVPPLPAAAPSAAIASAPPPEATEPRHRRHKPAAPVVASAPSLYDQVQERLKTSPKLRRVKAYTSGGTVTLFGKVFGEEEKSLAEETVRNIPGVTSVVDTITTDEGAWAQEQSQISQQLSNSGLDKVTVKVIGHDAFLGGEVKTDLEKTRAVTVAEGAAPVTVRENLIRVVPGNMFGF
ncbi:MAG TPA: BON domain-containing protein [Candidatus Binataceae bacterium]|nr:BON domain-containing protein [Candidatus Binataceae bacterium]